MASPTARPAHAGFSHAHLGFAELYPLLASLVSAPALSTLSVVVAMLSATVAKAADVPGTEDATKPCRPTVSCTADIAAPGTLEVETGALASKLEDHTRALAFPFLLKQSLTSLLQVQLGSNGYSTNTSSRSAPAEHYFDNIFLGPKLHLLDQGSYTPSIAISGEASFPTFQATGYSRNDDLFFVGYASKDAGPIHFDLNLGANVYRLEQAVTQTFGAFAVSAGVPRTPFGITLEGYAFSNAQPVASHDGGIRAFLALSPRPWWVFDVGGDVGVLKSTRVYSLFVGMTIIPVIFFRPATVSNN